MTSLARPETPTGSLGPSWLGDARTGVAPFAFEDNTRPWNWLELDRTAASQLWRILGEFVAFFNARYGERPELRIPPCWAEHGPLVEEITTLWWARWQAFESAHASVGGSQYWHTYTVPGFFERMTRWLGPDRLERCRQGRHEQRPDAERPQESASGITPNDVAAADIALREERGGRSTAGPVPDPSAQRLPIPFLERE
jgi:hypothetical protein